MIYFANDYMEGGHPEVMKILMATNSDHTPGYGADRYTSKAEKRILEECGLDNGRVFFLEGGTQTNMLVITRLLDYCDGVMAATSAHINVHEAGAIEAAGHKVIPIPSDDGKIKAEDVDEYLRSYHEDETYPHIVRPGMVYITFPTEVGTLYSSSELKKLSRVCRKWNIPLYLDGARLAYGLAADSNDLSLTEIAHLCDVFYIGGTKCGALFGEAAVTRRPEMLPNFFSLCKQRGAVLSKGRLLGVQFLSLFTDGLYGKIGKHAIRTAMKLKNGFLEKGYRQFIDSPTNQQFFILPNDTIESLEKEVSFELWGPMQAHETPVRFVTNWATDEKDIDRLLTLI